VSRKRSSSRRSAKRLGAPGAASRSSFDSRLTSHESRVAALALSVALASPAAHAFTIEHSATRYAERQFQCELTVTLDAPLERVEAVLRDYERYPTLDARILDAHIVERPADNVALLATTLRACFGWFCRTVKRIERVEEGPHALDAVTDAARSDVQFGETRTRLQAADEGVTRVTYSTRITPDFWIPPLVGRRWMLSTLDQATRELFKNVERKAQEATSY
jgi:hypothetical protein